MTQVDVVYRYGAAPSESAALALGNLREVYGIRRMEFKELEKTVCVEYDSTRLTEPVVRQLLRRAGLDVLDVVLMTKTPPPPVVAAPAAS
jgi:ABC-type nitrate/sulfonate/bicarbonate transport system substrate-binding protein